ncbi:zinc knuckle CX2CX4HX4C containing protein [Tanacetum coccineum]
MGGPAIATGFDNSREGNGDKVSFASLLKKPMPSKAVRLSMIKNDESVTGANVAIPLPAMEEVSKRFENTLYGYFIGKRLAFPVVENYVKNAWEKFGLERTMLSNGFFFFQFSSRDGMERVLENGPWLIRLVPIILNIWTPNTRLRKETITSAPIWVKLHNVPIVAYSKIGLSLITSQIGNPIMLDAYTSMMCQKSWGRNSYARALVEVSSLNPLQDSLVVAIPFPDGSGHSLESIEVDYEWTPPSQVEDDGFTKVNNRKNKKKQQSTNQQGSNRQVAGMKLTKPKLNLVYKVVNKQGTDEGTSSQPVEHQFKQPPKHAEKENLVSLSNSFETLNEFEDGPPIKKVYGSTIVDNLLSDDEEDKENVYDETINA